MPTCLGIFQLTNFLPHLALNRFSLSFGVSGPSSGSGEGVLESILICSSLGIDLVASRATDFCVWKAVVELILILLDCGESPSGLLSGSGGGHFGR